MFCRMTVLNIFAFTAKAAAYHHEEDRYEESSQYGLPLPSRQYASTYRILRAGTRAELITSGITPSMNANGSSRDPGTNASDGLSVASTRPFLLYPLSLWRIRR